MVKDDKKQEVTQATKIVEAAATSANTVTVKFDGVVDTTTATAIKLARGTTDITVTTAFADDAKSVILTSNTTFAAGTYTVTVGSFAPASFNVTKQTPTALKIANTKVANKDGARVYFEVLDQYGSVMSNYTANKLDVTAYNVTKGHTIYAGLQTKKDYFTLACSTENLANTGYLNAVGDKVSVVAYLKDNASVACTTELEITRIYTDSLTFGEIKLGDDKRVTVNRTYEIEYTAKDTEDKAVTFDEQPAAGGQLATVAFDYYNFISSNVSAVNMGDAFVDSEGRLKFVAGNTAGTAIITAINTITGATTDIKIVVNNTAKLSSVDIADASVACNASSGDKFKAAVTAYDQFGEVIDAKNVKNTNLNSGFGSYFNSITATPNGYIQINKITSDGKYVEYEVASDLSKMKNQTVTFNFVSKEMGETGYIRSSSTVTIDDEIEAAALEIVKAPDATVTEGGKVNVQFSVKDQYQNKMALTTSPDGIAYTGEYITSWTNSNGVVSSAAVTSEGDKVYKLELTAPMIDDLSKSGSFTLKLTDGGRTIASKLFNLVIVDSITGYSVSTDSDKYKAGDTIKVTVDAYSAGSFNANYNGSADVNINAAGKNYTKTLKFENGVASFELTAGTAGTGYKVTVTNKNDAAITANSDDYEVKGNAAGKLTVDAASGNFRITDSEGNATTTTATKTFATIKVTDDTMNKDITGDVSVNGWTLNDDKTVEVELDGDNIVTTIANGAYDLGATGLSITGVPATSYNHNIVFAITINGFTWEIKIAAGNTGNETVKDAGAATAAATAAANQAATDAVVAAWTTGKSITGAGTTVTDETTLKSALADEYTAAGYDIEIIIVTEPDSYADTKTGTYKVKVTHQTNGTTAETGELTVTLAS